MGVRNDDWPSVVEQVMSDAKPGETRAISDPSVRRADGTGQGTEATKRSDGTSSHSKIHEGDRKR